MAFSFSEVENIWLQQDHFAVLHCNIRSIKKNFDHLLSYLSQHSFKYDVIAITETWLRESESVHLPGYVMLSQPRNSATRGGGVALFIKDCFSFVHLSNSSCCSSSAETLFIHLQNGVIVGVIYRPPISSVADFITVMESTMIPIVASKAPIIVCGDINIDVSGDTCDDYVFLLQSVNLRNVISSPTRITDHSESIIDHVLCNADLDVSAGVYAVAIADHNPTFLFLPQKYICAPAIPAIKRTTRVDYNSVQKLLQGTNFDALYDEDVDVECDNIVKCIMDVIERSTRSCSRRNYDHAICPWMNRNILEVLKLKDFYYDKWKNNRSNEYYHQNFKLYRNKSVAMIRKSKKCYYTNLVKKNDGNTKKIWQIVKDVTGMGSKERITPDNPTREVADNFNDYFTNIGLSLARKFPTHMQNLNAPCTVTNNFDLCDVTEDDIRQVINKLPGNKAAGHDAISSRILKENIDVLCGPLCHIFNHAFSSKTYPSILKTAKVIPVYKSGDRNLPDSYRPISVLSSINTTLEKLISSQLRRFLGEQNVLCPQQHGFVANRSTSTAVSMLTQYINSALHENNIAIAVFLDIRKAFDAISHSILLEKMHSYGIKGNSLDFFSSYLSARKQKVVIGDIKSSYGYIKCGVPQGSVLGPILFSLYINDVPRSLQRSRALMYADDTVLVFTGHSLADLQNDAMTDLSNISEWFARNQLTVNCTKTKYMVFHSRRKHIDAESLNLTINNTPIQQVPCFKYLGVTFDEHLHWHEQVQSVCAKLAYGCYSLIKARQYFPQAILRTLYFSLCHCHIGYCLESWGVTYNSYLKTLERLQKRTLKIISQGESVSNIFQSQRILSVPMLRDYKIAVSVNNIINRNSPLPADLFSIPKRNTRHASNGNFNLPKCFNVYGERLIQFSGTKIWNTVPLEIKTARNFSMACKSFFLWSQDM